MPRKRRGAPCRHAGQEVRADELGDAELVEVKMDAEMTSYQDDIEEP
jgi:hypothetical protein